MLGRENIDHVTTHAERTAMKINVIALVLHLDEALDHFTLRHAVANTHDKNHLVILIAIADAVDARYGCDNHAIPAFEQALGRRKAHLFDMLVDRRVFLDEQVACRNIGLRLIVVVVRNEIFNGIFGEKLAKLRIQLRRQRLVWCQHQRRASRTGDDVSHGVGFSRTGDAQQGLIGQSISQPINQPGDCHRLIAGRQKRLTQAKRATFKGKERGIFERMQGTRHDRIINCFKADHRLTRRQFSRSVDDQMADWFALFLVTRGGKCGICMLHRARRTNQQT